MGPRKIRQRGQFALVLVTAAVGILLLTSKQPWSPPPRPAQPPLGSPTSVPTNNEKAGNAWLEQTGYVWRPQNATGVFEAFATWSQTYIGAVSQQSALVQQGVQLARQRRVALKELVQSEPERALDMAVPLAVRQQLPPAVSSLLEERVSGRGRLGVLAVLADPGSGQRLLFRVATIGNREYQAFVYGRRLGEPTRLNIPMHGIAVDGLLAVHEESARPLDAAEVRNAIGEGRLNPTDKICGISGLPASPETGGVALEVGASVEVVCRSDHVAAYNQQLAAAESAPSTEALAEGDSPAASPYTEGGKKIVFIRVDFADLPGAPFNDATGATMMNDLIAYFTDASYGKFQLASLGQGSAITPTFRMPNTAAYYGTNDFYTRLRANAQQAAEAAGYYMTNYQFDVICIGNVPGWIWAGLAFVGGPGAWLRNSFGAGFAAHEIGHNLGLNHANFWDTGGLSVIGTGRSVEYGDIFDTMGTGGSLRAYNARYRAYLNWITAEEIASATSNGVYRIVGYDAVNATGAKALKIRRSTSSSTDYWIELRQKNGATRWQTNGAGLRWAGSGNQNSILLDTTPGSAAGKDDSPLAIGWTFSDSSTDLHLTVLGKGNTTPESLDIQVNRGPFFGNLPPSVVISANTTNLAPGASATFMANASDPNGDTLAFGWDFGDEDSNTRSSPSVSHSWMQAGEYIVRCVVSDMKGGQSSEWIIVRVGAPNSYRISGRVTNQEGNPLENVRVYESSLRMAYTNPEGRYSLPGLPIGSYTVRASLDGWAFGSPEFSNPVSVGPANAENINFIGGRASKAKEVLLVPQASRWRYLDDGSDQGTNWVRLNFNDSNWGSGLAQLGYGDGDEATVVSYGPDPNRKCITTYFRQVFQVTNQLGLTEAKLNVLRDDGAVVYLNGREIFRSNIPQGAINYRTPALFSIAGVFESEFVQSVFDPDVLVQGPNVLAVEVHQFDATNSDLSFDLSLSVTELAEVAREVVINTLTNNTVLIGPTNIYITAEASAGLGHVIRKVEFFANDMRLGQSTAAPYGVIWYNVAPGSYAITAIGTDDNGLSITSAPVSVTVDAIPGAIYITAPASNSTVSIGPNGILISATANPGSWGNITKVEFLANDIKLGEAFVEPYQVFWTNVPPGTHTLVARLLTDIGMQMTSGPVIITATAPRTTVLVPRRSVWKYQNQGVDLGTSWRATNYNDSSWSSGAGPLGAGDSHIATVIGIGPPTARYPTVYFRRAFTVDFPTNNPYEALNVRLLRDDGAAVYLNGIQLLADGIALPSSYQAYATNTANGLQETSYFEFVLPATGLVRGTNVLAVEIKNRDATSEDLGFDLELEALLDTRPPFVLALHPPAASWTRIPELRYVDVIFDSPVRGVDASDLLATATLYDPRPAIIATMITPQEYLFEFARRETPFGIDMAWTTNHGFTDTSAFSNRFEGGSWRYEVDFQPLRPTVVLSSGLDWRYWDTGFEPTTNWTAPEYNDLFWKSGPAPLGYGGSESTVVSFGLDSNNKFPTYYFRKSFVVHNPVVDGLTLSYLIDDGAVFYLNGKELTRIRMPAGPVTYSTLSTGCCEFGWETIPIPANILVAGRNVLAVEVHQNQRTDGDVKFDAAIDRFIDTEGPVAVLIDPPPGATLTNFTRITIGFSEPVQGVDASDLLANGQPSLVVTQSNTGEYVFQFASPPTGTVQVAWSASHGITDFSVHSNGLARSPWSYLLITERVRHELIAAGGLWRYLDNGVDQGMNWIAPDFPDGLWSSGAAPLGYGEGDEATILSFGPNPNLKYPTYYFRKTFVVTNPRTYYGLILKHRIDDGAVFYLNGGELTRVRLLPGPVTFNTFVGGGGDYTWETNELPANLLVAGTNVFTAEVHQSDPGSSDLIFDVQLLGWDNAVPPLMVNATPEPGATLLGLDFITVTFDEEVLGVDADDLLVNNQPATNLLWISPREYTFYFPRPAAGTAQVSWATNHGITDTAGVRNPFGGPSWTYLIDPNSPPSRVVISEFLASNNHGIRDDNGNRSDWIELRNLGPLPVDLQGWFLTDDATNLTKWRFPSVILNKNKYLLVWASGEDRAVSTAPLHTNFRLSGQGEYLALVHPDGSIAFEFSPGFPAQQSDVSYGLDTADISIEGYFSTPTPGTANSAVGLDFVTAPVFSLPGGVYTNDSLPVLVSAGPAATVRYTLDGSVPTTTSPIYSGPITFSSNIIIKARAYSSNIQLWPSPVVAAAFVLLDSTVRDFQSKLPLMIISTGGKRITNDIAPGQARIPGSLTVIDAIGTQSSLQDSPDFHGLAEYEGVGQTRLGFPKQPLRIEIQDELRGDLAVPLLGMPAEADWRLQPSYSDKCLMNDFLAFELYEQMGRYSSRRRFVEVFVDTSGGRVSYPEDYNGVMVLLEPIEAGDERVNVARLSPTAPETEPTITGGYIWKKDKNSVGDVNFSTPGWSPFGGQSLKIHEPKPREITATQLDWLQSHLGAMERALYATDWLTATGTNHYSHYIDIDSWVDEHWIVEFTKEITGHRISAFWHKDRGGKIKMGPIWDWNTAFGNANYFSGGITNRWHYEVLSSSDSPWLLRLITGLTGPSGGGDPDFHQRIADRWGVLRTDVLYGPRILNRIDTLAAWLEEAAARDFAKYPRLGQYIFPNPDGGAWHVDYVHPTNYSGIISNMKHWVEGRFNWIDGQFAPTPLLNSGDARVTNGFVLTISAPPGAAIYYRLDGEDPCGFQGATNGLPYTGPITVNGNTRVVARTRTTNAWQGTWSAPVSATLYTAVPPLRISEIMYHPESPPDSSVYTDEDFEYIELKNIGGVSLNLRGYAISGEIDIKFETFILAPGAYAVAVANASAFRARYGSAIAIAGTYTGRLNNAGGRVTLRGPVSEPIYDFTYDDRWYPATDGFGFSLVSANETADPARLSSMSGWRPSAQRGGSPGVPDGQASAFGNVVVNEVVPYPDEAGHDIVELRNLAPTSAGIGGWFLTDDFRTPQKFRIPAHTTISAGGLIVFDETQFNTGPNAFSFDSSGGEVYLFSGDGTNLTGYASGFRFGAAPVGGSFGRYVVSTGQEQFPLQIDSTPGAENAGPLIGPVVITEIMYEPLLSSEAPVDNLFDEYIELHNFSSEPVSLYDPGAPTNTWRVGGSIDFAFPSGTIIEPGGFVLVVSFDPAKSSRTDAFRVHNEVPDGVPIFGPYSGPLPNGGGKVALYRPDGEDPAALLRYVLVDEVDYSRPGGSTAPRGGFGLSLQRLAPSGYGNDPANWRELASSPGAPSGYAPDSIPPSITSQPANQLTTTSRDLFLAVSATGTPPLRYRWLFNGLQMPGFTSSSIVLTNFQFRQAGEYSVIVYNSAGAARSATFRITAREGVRFTIQPLGREASFGLSVPLFVGAIGTGTIRYQWKFNGVNIPGATQTNLVINTSQGNTEGVYTCVITDDFDSITSQPALLTILYRPFFVAHPIPQTIVEGGVAVFTAGATGTPPIGFVWRKGSVFISNFGFVGRQSNNTYLIISNVTPAEATNYSVFATNRVGTALGGPLFGFSSNATLVVLADADRDGLPDAWENGRPGFSPSDPRDAARDDDHDGMSNGAEYFAGTDYLDPASNLRVSIAPTGIATIQFLAISNRAYSVQFTDGKDPIVWRNLAAIISRSTTRQERIIDPNSGTNRFYRIVTPLQP